MEGEDKKQPELSASSLLQGKDEGSRHGNKLNFILLQPFFNLIL